MDDVESQECGLYPTQLSDSVCLTQLSGSNFLENFFVSSLGSNKETYLQPEANVIKKFLLNAPNSEDEILSDFNVFAPTTFFSDNCTCDYVTLEVHYKVFYSLIAD